MDVQKSQQPAWIHQPEYVRLSQAAELIGSTADRLLHLGAIGKVDVLAPVLAEGWYEWPVSSTGLPYPENGTRFATVRFGIHSRVILALRDVANIEALGWVIPKAFFCPEAVEEHIELWKDLNPRVYAQLQKSAESVPWYAVEPVESDSPEAKQQVQDALQITPEHLFISIKEIERLKRNAPQDKGAEERKSAPPELEKKSHRNTEINSEIRQQVLMAAIACLFNEQKIKMTGVAWASLIDEKGALFWNTRIPPLSRDSIERLLNRAKSYPETAEWEGG